MLVELNEKEFRTLKRVLESTDEFTKYKSKIPAEIVKKIENNTDKCDETCYKEIVTELAKRNVSFKTNYQGNIIFYADNFEKAADSVIYFEVEQENREFASGDEPYLIIKTDYLDKDYKDVYDNFIPNTAEEAISFLSKYDLAKNRTKRKIKNKEKQIKEVAEALTQWALDNVKGAPDWTSEIVDDFIDDGYITNEDMMSMNAEEIVSKYSSDLHDFVIQMR